MNNFVNIKKLEKIYFLQEFLKESLGDGKKLPSCKRSIKLFNRKLSLKAFKLINRM